MKRRRRNTARFSRRQYAVAAAVGGIGAIGVYWYLKNSKSSGMKVIPAVLTLPGPQPGSGQPAPDDKTRSYAASVTVEVSKFGDTYDVVLHGVDPGDEFDIQVEATISHYMKSNEFYGALHHEFCLGVVLRGHVSVDAHKATISNATVELAPLLCADNELLIPWPSAQSGYGDLVPKPSLDIDGHDLVISIEAPPLMYGNEIVEPGKGYSTDWWKQHTQPHAYDMLVTLAVTETKT